MQPSEIAMLSRISQPRFRSFSEATDGILGALAGALPGLVALSRRDPDDDAHRLIESRGEGVTGLARGAVLPLAGGVADADFLRSLGGRDWRSSPLEMSDGRIVGLLCAVDAAADAFGPEHAAQLDLAARLLSHEWENVELRSELRHLRSRLNADPSTDAETGIPDREGFLELLGQEWRLAERGTVQSVLVVCRVDGGTAAGAKDRLALKLAADTLQATVRDTDRVGRIAELTLGAILVGCSPQDTPAFLARFLGAFERVTEGRRPRIEVSCGVQPLADAPSATGALDMAEMAAGGEAGQQAPAGASEASR